MDSCFFRESVPGGAKLFAPNHPDFRYTGRIDHADAEAPVLIWEGSELAFTFSGRRVGFRFGQPHGRVCFNVVIDGRAHLLKVQQGGGVHVVEEELSEGPHTVSLFKRTEASMGHVALTGVICDREASILESPPAKPLCIEFYGDSITAGACNEDPGVDQYEDLSTHNNYLAYGAITARNLNAEYRCIAVSGIGLCDSWDPRVMPQIWDKLYVDPEGRKFDFSLRHPHIVVMNLGQNDSGFPHFDWRRVSPDYAKRYVELRHAIAGKYPEARFVHAIGCLGAYQADAAFRRAWDEAIDQLTPLGDAHFVFEARSNTHPRVDVHARMAEELTSFIVARYFLPALDAGDAAL